MAAKTAAASGAGSTPRQTRLRPPRGPVRRAAERAFGMLLLTRLLAVGAVVVLLLAAAAWQSWQGSRDALLTSRERGMFTVASCDGSTCRGGFVPQDARQAALGPLVDVTIDQSSLPPKDLRPGAQFGAALRPHTSTAVRTGLAGVLRSWLPMGGALLLGALITAGGLRMRRTAWVQGALGGALIVAAFLLTGR